MLFLALTLTLVLSVTFSLPTFLVLLNGQHERVSPAIATVGTAALMGSLVLLGAQLGWAYAATVLITAGAFDRFVYAPRTGFTHALGAGTAFALLLTGIAMGGGPTGMSPAAHHLLCCAPQQEAAALSR